MRAYRTAAHLQARLAYKRTTFDVVLHLFEQFHLDDVFKLSIIEIPSRFASVASGQLKVCPPSL